MTVLDLKTHIRPGDTIFWGEGIAEPQTLVEELIDQRADLGGVTVFLGMGVSETLKPEHGDHIKALCYGAIGKTARLVASGMAKVIPCHLSAVPTLIRSGHISADVVFVQVSPKGPDGLHSFGFCQGTLPAAIEKARVVIGEVNAQVPWVHGGGPARLDMVIETDRKPVVYAPPKAGAVELRIAEHVASIIPNGSIIQYGVGGLLEAVILGLRDHKDLSVHSGILTEALVNLDEAGALSETIAGAIAVGSSAIAEWIRENPKVQIREFDFTHGIRSLVALENFAAINSAIEVDLTGQVNAETVGDRYLGGIGGQSDFMRAAAASPTGRSIIALPASAAKGTRSRIVEKIASSTITTHKGDVDFVVTEFGIADLRGTSFEERAKRLRAIASPDLEL